MTIHSYSAMSTFLQCPRRYEAQYLLKTHRDAGSDASDRGNRIHAEIEAYLKGERADIPSETPRDALLAVLRKANAQAEVPLAVRHDGSPCDFWAKDGRLRGKIDVLTELDGTVIAIDWKGLACDTPIPTPSGWATMESLKEGDFVFGSDGRPACVTGKSRVKNIRCYRVSFDDKTDIVCDEEHLWKLADGTVKSVTALHPKDRIAVAEPLITIPAALPVDPYVLGLWLADGKHTSGEISKPDLFVWEEIQRRGYKVDMETGGKGTPTRTVRGLRTALRENGLLGNKHIPAIYLRASFNQRLDLLRGLMDGDGNANPHRKQAVFTTCDKALSDQVYELIVSLGMRVNQCRTMQRGFGLTVTAWPLHFRPWRGHVFYLPRKRNRMGLPTPGNSDTRRVVQVEEVPSVPTVCISVGSVDQTFLCGRAMIPTHNTGKRRDNSLQAAVYGYMLSAYYPGQLIRIVFDYLSNGRDPAYHYDTEMKKRVENLMEDMETTQVFPPKPSGLCGWCPVNSCEYWRERR